MYVHARLTRSFTHVDSDVVAVRRERELCVALSLAKQLKDGVLLVWRHVEEIGHVTLGYDKHVTTAQRVIVVAHISQSVLQNSIGGIAQFAL